MQDIQVGNICKFEDFEPLPGRQACYKIGRVTAVDENYIHYDVLLDIWRGENQAVNSTDTLRAPQPGTFITDWPTRIQVLS